MNLLHHSDGGRGNLVESTTNAVLEQQRRLAAEFGSKQSDPPDHLKSMGPFERILCAILNAIGWRGEQHRIFEALPHVEPIQSFRKLRSVLARLEVGLIPIERGPAELAGEDFPCLLVESNDNCRLLMQAAGSKVACFDLTSGARSEVDYRLLNGSVYLIRSNRKVDAAGIRPFGGYVGHVLKQMRGSILRIAGYSAAINALGLIPLALCAAGLRHRHRHQVTGYARVPGNRRTDGAGP